MYRYSRGISDADGHQSIPGHMPRRDTLGGLVKGLGEGHAAFCRLHDVPSSDAVMVMVVQSKEWNVFDQLWLQVYFLNMLHVCCYKETRWLGMQS